MRISEIRNIFVLIIKALNLSEHAFSVNTSGITGPGMAQNGGGGEGDASDITMGPVLIYYNNELYIMNFIQNSKHKHVSIVSFTKLKHKLLFPV
jgi:hypothetical protein